MAERYLQGLAQAEEATFAAMATVVEQGCEQQFQHFISNSPWRHEPVVEQIGRDADRLLGGKPTSALIIDESSFVKQGEHSVGKVSRWGRAENDRLHPSGVRQILLRRAEQAGIEGTALAPISPHGLRAGFVTQAYKAGLRDEEIMQHSRHRDLRTMRRYVRRARLLEDSPAKRLEL